MSIRPQTRLYNLPAIQHRSGQIKILSQLKSNLKVPTTCKKLSAWHDSKWKASSTESTGPALAPFVSIQPAMNLSSTTIGQLYHKLIPSSTKTTDRSHSKTNCKQTFPSVSIDADLEKFNGRKGKQAWIARNQKAHVRKVRTAGSVGRRQGYNCNLGTRYFWG